MWFRSRGDAVRNGKRKTENGKRSTSQELRVMSTVLRAALAILIASACATAFAQATVPAGNAQAGRKVFASNGCYECHGYEAQGATPTGPRLGPRPLAFAAFS